MANYRLASGWNQCLPRRQPHPPLGENLNVDVVIIGAGFTGIACANRWQALDPNAKIVLIDASEIGEGNPGRNSGFLLEIALAEDADPSNLSTMAEANRLTRAAMGTLSDAVSMFGDPSDLHRAGTYRAAASDVGLSSLAKYETFLKAAGLTYRRLSASELKQELGTDFYQAGLYSPDCYLAQPAAVIRALASTLPKTVQVYENTQALSVTPFAGAWRVQTPNGRLTCQKVVLANNAFATQLGFARSRMAAVYTYAGLTGPLSKRKLAELGANPDWGLLPTHRFGSTLRRTHDGRLLIRSLHDYEKEREVSSIERALKLRLQRRFPQLNPIEFESIWGGAVGFTLNGGLVWGELEPSLYASCGCNGGGTVKGTLLGQLLAEHALGYEVPNVLALFGDASWMPPEPFRTVGFHARSLWQGWEGRHER